MAPNLNQQRLRKLIEDAHVPHADLTPMGDCIMEAHGDGDRCSECRRVRQAQAKLEAEAALALPRLLDYIAELECKTTETT